MFRGQYCCKWINFGSRALFSIKQSIFHSTIKPSAVMRIFDSLIKPIALSNSEIWAGYKTCYQNKSLDELFDMSFKCNNEFDNIFTRFFKYVLGVHSKATKFAVFSELGQCPMQISVIARCINFWIHTIQSGNESLLSEAYLEQCNKPSFKKLMVKFCKQERHEALNRSPEYTGQSITFNFKI